MTLNWRKWSAYVLAVLHFAEGFSPLFVGWLNFFELLLPHPFKLSARLMFAKSTSFDVTDVIRLSLSFSPAQVSLVREENASLMFMIIATHF